MNIIEQQLHDMYMIKVSNVRFIPISDLVHEIMVIFFKYNVLCLNWKYMLFRFHVHLWRDRKKQQKSITKKLNTIRLVYSTN